MDFDTFVAHKGWGIGRRFNREGEKDRERV